MPDLLTSSQLVLSLLLLGVVVERTYYLGYAWPLSPKGADFVLRALRGASDAELRAFADAAAHTHVGRVLLSAFAHPSTEPRRREDALAELAFELAAEASARLRVVRVGATLASTTGLLVGIVRLRGGVANSPGLLALQAGLSERMAVGDALFSMAIGVATSAVCFYALAVLRDAARVLAAQRSRVEKVVLEHLRPASL